MTNSSTSSPAPERFTILFVLLALMLGIGCGVLHVFVETMTEPDPLLSALAVTIATMFMGVLAPARPWRWVLLIGAPVPLAMAVATLVMPTVDFTRAAIAGSVLIALPGCAGAFGGSILRRKTAQLFSDEEEEAPTHSHQS